MVLKTIAVTVVFTTHLLSVTETAIESGCRSGTDETHATLAKLCEKRIVAWDLDSKTFWMQELCIVQ